MTPTAGDASCRSLIDTDWFGVWQSAASNVPAPRPQRKGAAGEAPNGAAADRRSNAAKRTADRGPANKNHGAAPA